MKEDIAVLQIYFRFEDRDPLDLDIVQSNRVTVSVPRHLELDSCRRLLLHVDVELSVGPVVVSDIAPSQIQDLALIPRAEIYDGNCETWIEIWNVLLRDN